MRTAAIHLYALPLEAAFGIAHEPTREPSKKTKRAAHASSPEKPLRARAVKESAGGRTVLVAISKEARAAGVLPGMTLVEGRSRCPELEVRARDRAAEARLLEAAAEALFAFGPIVEVASPTHLLVEIGRSAQALRGMLGIDEGAMADDPALLERTAGEAIRRTILSFGHRSSVAVADEPDTARTLAQWAPSEQVVIALPGRSRESIAPLPIEALLWTDALDDPEGHLRQRMRDVNASLRVLGVKNAGHLAEFPVAQVKSRFGDAGALLMDRALGRGERPLRSYTPAEEAVESYAFDTAVDGLEPVLFVIKRLLDRLETRLLARGRAASSLSMHFLVDPNPDQDRNVPGRVPVKRRSRGSRSTEQLGIPLARPTRSSRTLLTLCREALNGGALSGAVREVKLSADLLVPDSGAQLDLFSQHARRIEAVEELVSRLQTSLGEQAVFAAELLDTHRPESAWHKKPFEIARAFEPEPKAGQLRKDPRKAVHALTRSLPRESLPEPKPELRVAVAPEEIEAPPVVVQEGSAEVLEAPPAGSRAARRRNKSWPKTIKRSLDQEPAPKLPPRPLELLREPEPARWTDRDSGTLDWRGESHPVLAWVGRERFECEWWRSTPLDREYVIAELDDGRRLWVYSDQGALFVHGVFD